MNRSTTGSVLMFAVVLAGCTTHSPTASNNVSQIPHDPPETRPDAPLTANTHFAAGQVAESQGDLPRAAIQYEAACKLDSTATVPLLRLGMLYTRLAEFDQAVDAWNRYIKATKGNAAGYCDLGYTLELAQRFGEAEAAYKTAVQKQPTNQTARVNYGLMLARQGRTKEATEQLSAALTPAEVHYNLASVLESLGKKNDAKAEYEQALLLDPTMSDAQFRLAAIDTR